MINRIFCYHANNGIIKLLNFQIRNQTRFFFYFGDAIFQISNSPDLIKTNHDKQYSKIKKKLSQKYCRFSWRNKYAI